MIVVDNLTKTYPNQVTALNGINLHIGAGMFGLLGPNGAGKTTLMRIMTGLLRPTSGTVRVDDCDISTPHGRQQIKSELGYLPQELGTYPDMTARDFLDYVAILKGVTNPRARRAQLDELLELVHLSDAADRKLKTFSGGMKRRIGIAQTMLGSPRLLIVDEPTVGLDPQERVRIRNTLSEMALRCTVILSTHVIEDIGHSCNDLAIIQGGRVLYRGAPGDLIQAARGHVWSVTTQGEFLDESLIVISTLQLQDRIQYRVLGTPAPHYQAVPLEPGLEDGYMLVMHRETIRL